MSADRLRLQWAVVLGLIAGAGAAAAADDALPDLDFLEYLGSWEESDEDWLLFDEFAGEPAAGDENPQDETDAAAAPDPAASELTERE